MKKICKQCHFYCTKGNTNDALDWRPAIYLWRPGIAQSYVEFDDRKPYCAMKFGCYFEEWLVVFNSFATTEETTKIKDLLKNHQNKKCCCGKFMEYNPEVTLDCMLQKITEKIENKKSVKKRLIDYLLGFISGLIIAKIDVMLSFIYHLIKGN